MACTGTGTGAASAHLPSISHAGRVQPVCTLPQRPADWRASTCVVAPRSAAGYCPSRCKNVNKAHYATLNCVCAALSPSVCPNAYSALHSPWSHCVSIELHLKWAAPPWHDTGPCNASSLLQSTAAEADTNHPHIHEHYCCSHAKARPACPEELCCGTNTTCA